MASPTCGAQARSRSGGNGKGGLRFTRYDYCIVSWIMPSMAGIWDPLVIILSVPDKRIHQSGAAWLAFAYLESSTRWEGLKQLVKSL